MKYNEKDIAKRIANSLNKPEEEVLKVLESAFAQIKKDVMSGKKVLWPGLGIFEWNSSQNKIKFTPSFGQA